jgi:hypothetical protein
MVGRAGFDRDDYQAPSNAINTYPAIGVTQSATASATTANGSPNTCTANAMTKDFKRLLVVQDNELRELRQLYSTKCAKINHISLLKQA